MSDLSRQRCFHHAGREAVARCLECGRFYCLECVTEHAGRLICAVCLEALTARPKRRFAWARALFTAARVALAFIALWLFFYAAGAAALRIPSEFHDGVVWEDDDAEENAP